MELIYILLLEDDCNDKLHLLLDFRVVVRDISFAHMHSYSSL
jgi:hypothetical protein